MKSSKVKTQAIATFDVPAYSQFLDVNEKKWQTSACGIVSLKMVLDFWNVHAPDCDTLIKEGLKIDGYIPGIGWKHAALADLAQQYGLTAINFDWAQDSSTSAFQKMNRMLATTPIIASIYKNLQLGNSGHLVVVTKIDNKQQIIDYLDPHSKTRKEIKRSADIKKFKGGWKQRIVVAHPNTV